MQVNEIRKEANYSGIRVTLTGELSGARCYVQIDVGFGDAVTPGPEEITYPLLVEGLPAPALLAYPKDTVVAEKFEAMVSLGMANSRMKDYFDIWVLAHNLEFDGCILQEAIRATFKRRATPIPKKLPLALSDEFSGDSQKLILWDAFLKKNAIDAVSLAEVVTELREFLLPLTEKLADDTSYSDVWVLGGSWTPVG